VADRPSDAEDVGTLDQRFDVLRALGSNWDSYGGAPIDPRALRAAQSFVVVPRSNGGVQLEWNSETEVVFEPDGSIVHESVPSAPSAEALARHALTFTGGWTGLCSCGHSIGFPASSDALRLAWARHALEASCG